MKLLFISPSNTSGGAERVMTTLVNELSNEHEIAFVTFDSKSNFYSIKKCVQQFRMGLVSNGNSKLKALSIGKLELRRYNALIEILKKYKPDCVISFLFMPNLLSILACKKLNIPIIISERNDPLKYNKFKKITMKMFYKQATGIVCQSNHVKDISDKDYALENSCVIPNPINETQYTDEFVWNKNPKIISVGRLVPQKNHLMTIKAFKQICNKHPQAQLYIYGEGPLRPELENTVQKLKLDNRIFFPGVESEVMKKNSDAILYVMSSDFEGFPNALVEAMANGVLSITTDFDSRSARDLIINKKNGFLIPTEAVNTLAEHMDNVLSNPDNYIALAKSGKEIINLIGVDSVKEKWVDFINLVLDKNKKK